MILTTIVRCCSRVVYRMLGTVTNAEDMVQETFLRWQQTASQKVGQPMQGF